jgi:sigma-E factor negative regulatory protein RseA
MDVTMPIKPHDEERPMAVGAPAAVPGDVVALERLSALVDGACTRPELDAVMGDVAVRDDLRQAWVEYHWMGEVMRSGRQAGTPADAGFVAAVMARVVEQDTTVGRSDPDGAATQAEAANDPVFRWKMVAGLASLVAVFAVAWNVALGPAQRGAAELAQATEPPVVAAGGVVRDSVVVTERGILIRDPQLEALMAAHRQVGGMSALEMPAGFLRNATFEGPQR